MADLSGMSQIIARGLPAIDPAGDYYRQAAQQQEAQLRRQQMLQAAQMGPLLQQEAQARAQEYQQRAQEYQQRVAAAQADQEEHRKYLEVMNDPTVAGDPHKALPKLAMIFRPATLEHFTKALSDQDTANTTQATNAQTLADKQTADDAGMAAGVANTDYDPKAYTAMVNQRLLHKRITPEEAAAQLDAASDPVAVKKYTDQLIARHEATRKGVEESAKAKRDAAAAATTADAAERGQIAVESQFVRDDPSYQKLLSRHPDWVKNHPGVLPDTYTPGLEKQIRGLGISAEKQAELEKPKEAAPTEFNQFMSKNAALIIGPDGKPKTVDQLTAPEYNGLVRKYKETTAPPEKESSATGTWTLQEDQNGKPVLFNSKTGETKAPPPGMQKAGTAAKEAEITRPIEEAYTYAHNYLNNKNFTGPGDEALLAKFFELEKVSKGFRMTQPQINMLLNARGWTGTVAAKFRHATQGTWLDDDQRKQIVNTIDDLYKTKQSSRGGATVPAPQGNRPPLSSFER